MKIQLQPTPEDEQARIEQQATNMQSTQETEKKPKGGRGWLW